LVSTNSARWRLSFGGIGGYLVIKFVKQTTVDSGIADQSGLDQVALVKTEAEERTGGARVLGKADAAVRKEQPRLDAVDRVFDQAGELLPLCVGDGGAEVLDFDQPLADEYIAMNSSN